MPLYYVANQPFGYNDLAHHGILGQKWGVRRFQNADGSLTPAGRERYAIYGGHINVKRDLNRMDQQKAYSDWDYTKAVNKAAKFEKKINKRAAKLGISGKDISSSTDKRLQKYSNKKQASLNDASNVAARMKDLDDQINRLLDYADEQGFGVSVKNIPRESIRFGEGFINSLPASLMATSMAMVSPVGFGIGISNKPVSRIVPGKQYKVKENNLTKEENQRFDERERSMWRADSEYNKIKKSTGSAPRLSSGVKKQISELWSKTDPDLSNKTQMARYYDSLFKLIDSLPPDQQVAAKRYASGFENDKYESIYGL